MLKPQDFVVAIRLAMPGQADWTYPELASALRMSASEAHAAVKRAVRSGLVDESTRSTRKSALLEFLVHGVRYFVPPVWTGITRGLPTSYAAPPLNASVVADEFPPVWPHAEGTTRGQGLVPVYRSVPEAALRDTEFHQWLALVDAIRSGRARERELASRILRERLT
jgi:hypothetical protein